MTPQFFTAAKGFIARDNKILLLREADTYKTGTQTGRYDVPGGRIDVNESMTDGLAREIAEECGLPLLTADHFFTNTVTIPRPDSVWVITRHFFICTVGLGDIVLSADHDDAQWIDPARYRDFAVIENLHEVFEAYAAMRASTS